MDLKGYMAPVLASWDGIWFYGKVCSKLFIIICDFPSSVKYVFMLAKYVINDLDTLALKTVCFYESNSPEVFFSKPSGMICKLPN